MIVIIPRLKAKPGSASELERILRKVLVATHLETPPPAVYQVSRSQADPNSFIIVEIFANADALKRHAESPHLQQALPVIESLLAEPWTAEYFDMLE